MNKPSVKAASLVEYFLIAFILLYAGIRFTLPVPYNEDISSLYPWWAKTISFGNVILYELVFILWLALFGGKYILRALLNAGLPGREPAVWLLFFALWVGVISLSGPLVLQDIGRTLRLLLNVALILAAFRWARQDGVTAMLWLILGFLIGTIINFVISFQHPLIVAGIMRLSGQNTPGVAMGIAIHLSAWVFLMTTQQLTRALMLFASLLFLFGAAISYSRIGWGVSVFGSIAWAYVLAVANPRYFEQIRALRKSRRYLLPMLGMSIITMFVVLDGYQLVGWISALLDQKLGSGRVIGGDQSRWAYVIGTLEILMQRPWGVGYSGFFDAMTNTAIYRSGAASPEVGYGANPHASFLFFATAGGVPGFLMGLVVFILLLNTMRVGLRSAIGRPGIVLFWLIVFPYFVIGMTVPYLLNSVILIVPASIASGWGWMRRVQIESTSPNKISLDHAD